MLIEYPVQIKFVIIIIWILEQLESESGPRRFTLTLFLLCMLPAFLFSVL